MSLKFEPLYNCRSVSDKDVRKYEVFRQKMLAAASGANDKIGGASADGET